MSKVEVGHRSASSKSQIANLRKHCIENVYHDSSVNDVQSIGCDIHHTLHITSICNSAMSDQDADTIDDFTIDNTIDEQEDTAVATSPTEDELERFRVEWQQELQQRKQPFLGVQKKNNLQERTKGSALGQFQASSDAASSASKSQSRGGGRTSDFDGTPKHDPPSKSPSTSPKISHRLPNSPTKTAAQIEPVGGQSHANNVASSSSKAAKEVKGKRALKVAHAVEQYANAVELEQMGRLNEALQLYRGAYKLDRELSTSVCLLIPRGLCAERLGLSL